MAIYTRLDGLDFKVQVSKCFRENFTNRVNSMIYIYEGFHFLF